MSIGHLELVDGALVLGVLGLGVAGVDDLLVVILQLLADGPLGVQVLVGGRGLAILLLVPLNLGTRGISSGETTELVCQKSQTQPRKTGGGPT